MEGVRLDAGKPLMFVGGVLDLTYPFSGACDID